jgi:hypothetical protein
MVGIEASRGNKGQASRSGKRSVFLVDVEQHRHPWPFGTLFGPATAPEQVRQARANGCRATSTHTRYRFEPPVVSGNLERFEGIHLQVIVDSFGEHRANPRHRLKQPLGSHSTAQTIKSRVATGASNLGNRGGKASTDERQLQQPFEPFAGQKITNVDIETLYGLRCPPIGVDAERVRALRRQQISSIKQRPRHRSIEGGRRS